jgi:GNAT superfamily N-acetyltransferase
VVAEATGRVCGVGLLRRSGELLLFYVASGHQRCGVGRSVHSALETWARTSGLCRLHLESTASARAYIESMGFRPTGAARPLFGVLRVYPYEKRL